MEKIQTTEKLVSIIIPVYNAKKYIHRCVASILAVNSNDLELILVDDGSSDGTTEECYALKEKDSRIRVIKKQNEGVSSARNKGLAIAVGKYIMFADADDYYITGRLEAILDILKTNDRIECAFFNYQIEYKNNRIPINMEEDQYLTSKPVSYIAKEYWNLYKKGVINPVWNKIYRLDIIKKNDINFDWKITMGEDGLFNLNYFSCCKNIILVDENCYVYVRHGIQATTRMQSGFFKMMDKIYDEIEIFITKYAELNNEYYRNWLEVICNTFYHQNYVMDNKEEILNNHRTIEMCKNLIPLNHKERISFGLIKIRRLEILNAFYFIKFCLAKIRRRWKVKP